MGVRIPLGLLFLRPHNGMERDGLDASDTPVGVGGIKEDPAATLIVRSKCVLSPPVDGHPIDPAAEP